MISLKANKICNILLTVKKNKKNKKTTQIFYPQKGRWLEKKNFFLLYSEYY